MKRHKKAKVKNLHKFLEENLDKYGEYDVELVDSTMMLHNGSMERKALVDNDGKKVYFVMSYFSGDDKNG